MDSIHSHRVFSNASGVLGYPLLSDFHPKGKAVEEYGVMGERGFARRSVFLIDKQGVVRFKKEYASAYDVKTDELLTELDKMG